MRKTIFIVLLVILSFASGFAFNSLINESTKQDEKAFKKVTGIGGIFFKSKDPKSLREWYKMNLGIEVNQYGSVFEWRQATDTTKKGFTQWSPFNEKTKYFDPSTKEFMINYRVADLSRLIDTLRLAKVNILDTIANYDYGKFVHIMDTEGNKIELWEPNDAVYEKMGIEMGLKTTK